MSAAETPAPETDAGTPSAGLDPAVVAALLSALPVVLALGVALPELPQVSTAAAGALGGALERGLSLLPLGPASLRSALTTALLSAGCAALLQRAGAAIMLLRGLDGPPALALSVAASWAVAGSGALLTDRAEPALLSLSLSLLCVERLTAQLALGPTLSVRPLSLAALWLGMLAGVAPWLALGLALPVALELRRCLHARGRPMWPAGVALIGALSALPALLQGALGAAPPSGSWLPHSPVALALGALGLATGLLLIARGQQRRLALPWLVAAAAGALAPDGAGPGLRLSLCAAGVLVVAALPALLAGRGGGFRWQLVALSLAALGLLQLREAALHGGPAQPGFADHWADGSLRRLPARAVVIAGEASAARLRGLQRLEGARPDLVALAEAELGDAGRAEALAAAEPTLKGLLRTRLIDGHLSPFELQSLAARRPVYVERAPALPGARAARERQAELDETAVPEGAYERVQTSAVASNDVDAAAGVQRRHYGRLEARVALSSLDDDAAALLGERHLSDALHFLRAGEQRGAREALERALVVAPDAELAGRLLEAVEAVPKGERFDGEAILEAARQAR